LISYCDDTRSHKMSDARVARFKKRFPERVFADIGACLREGQAVGATILLCCAVDVMARYYSGQPKGRLDRQSYISFMERYFSTYYDAVHFYRFVRCGLVHGYDMEREYLILGSPAPWARKLNMVHDPKHKTTIVNPFAVYSDVRRAFRAFVSEIGEHVEVKRRFLRVWKASPFEKQQLSSDKFYYLKEQAGAMAASDIRSRGRKQGLRPG
jgi:hypothetical protein